MPSEENRRSKLRIILALLVFAAAGWVLWQGVMIRYLGPAPVVAEGLERADPMVRQAVDSAIEEVRRDRRDLDSRQRLCMVYQANGLMESAQACWSQVLAIEDGLAHGWFYLATTYERAGRMEEAIEAMARSSAIDPNHAASYWQRALWLIDIGSLDEAELALAMARDLDPTHEAVWFATARLHLARQDPEAAVSVIDEHRLVDGRNAAYARQLQAAAYRALGRSDEAEQLASSSSPRAPAFEDPWMAMIQRYRTGSSHLATVATQLTKSGRYSEALEVLGRIEGLLTDDPRLAAVAAQCWLGLGEPARAVEILRQATLGAPQNPVLQTNLALAALAGADSDPSLLDLSLEAALRAVEIDPSSRQTRLALARALVANGRSQEAVVEYRRAFESDARDPVAVIRAAHRLIAESHLSEARELLELVAGTHPERASVWAGLARIEEISGNEAEAERLLALAAAAKVQDAGDLAAATGSYAMDTSDS